MQVNDETPFLKRYVVFFWAVQTVDIVKPFQRIVVFFFLRTFEGLLILFFTKRYDLVINLGYFNGI